MSIESFNHTLFEKDWDKHLNWHLCVLSISMYLQKQIDFAPK